MLADLRSLDGKEIAVRGEWNNGYHGQWLSAPGLECPNKLVTEGFVWHNTIHLVEDKADRLDVRSLAEVSLQLDATQGNSEQYTKTATFIGTLQTKIPLAVAHYPDGTVTGAGFGHLNGAAAELLYRSMKNMVIQKRPEPHPTPK